jgi:hypothetical protein
MSSASRNMPLCIERYKYVASRPVLHLKPGGFLSAKYVENPIYGTCCVR